MASLIALSRAKLEEAKTSFSLRLYCHIATLVMAVLSTFFVNSYVLYSLALFSLITELAAWYFAYDGSRKHDLAEEAKRKALLMDALGENCEPLDLEDLKLQFGERTQEVAKEMEDNAYYSSSEQTGLARLRDHIQESAFFSKHLFRSSASTAIIIAIALLVPLLIATYFILPVAGDTLALRVAHIIVVVLSALPSIDYIGRALAWYSASVKCETVDRRLENSALNSMEQALSVFADYCVATASVPPISTKLYDKKRNDLNLGWNRRKEGRKE